MKFVMEGGRMWRLLVFFLSLDHTTQKLLQEQLLTKPERFFHPLDLMYIFLLFSKVFGKTLQKKADIDLFFNVSPEKYFNLFFK